MKENPANDIKDTMWKFLMDKGQKSNIPALKEYVYDLIQMTTQKTAGQRKAKDHISWDELDMTIMSIVIEATALVLSGDLDEIEGQVHDISGIAKCHSSGHNNSPKIAIPVIDVAHTEKNQNGKRFKENGDSMFTLTAQDRHGVGIGVRYTENGFHLYRKDKKKSTIQGTHVTYQNGNVQCLGTTHAPMTMEKIGIIDPQGRNKKEVSPKDIRPTLRSETHGNLPNVCVNIHETSNYGNGIYVEMPEGFIVYAIWYEKEHCYITIRKLTPKECFRLQGWTDDYFEKAAFINSDSQLYKQAGNGVTVDVVKAIGDKIKEYEKQRIPHNPRHDTAEQAGIGIKSKLGSGYDLYILDEDMTHQYAQLHFCNKEAIDRMIDLLQRMKELWEREERGEDLLTQK